MCFQGNPHNAYKENAIESLMVAESGVAVLAVEEVLLTIQVPVLSLLFTVKSAS